MATTHNDTASSTTTVTSVEATKVVARSSFEEYLNTAPPQGDDETRQELLRAFKTLTDEIAKNAAVVPSSALKTIDDCIAEIDAQLSDQLNEVMHAPEFQSLERAWRGLHFLVSKTKVDSTQKIKVLNVSRDELTSDLEENADDNWMESELYRKVYRQGYEQLGGQPFGCLIGDYYFDHKAADCTLLERISRVAAVAHAPFIAAASPSLLGLKDWTEIGNPKRIDVLFDQKWYAKWQSLRESPDARYLGLTLPRFLVRLPYGKDNKAKGLNFQETAGSHENDFCWANSAYAMALNINRAFTDYGWCANIRGVESGGQLTGLPLHLYETSDGATDFICPTEVAIDGQRDQELSKAGLMPLAHEKNSDKAVFFTAQSIQKPKEYPKTEAGNIAAANAKISSRLPYIFAASRFAHYLKCIMRDKIGSAEWGSSERIQRWLTEWVDQYVEPSPENAGVRALAERPLRDAKIEIEADPANPGYYVARIKLQPHFQLEGLSTTLSMVSRITPRK